ncbi:MAG: hypothetical protein RIS17_351 [Pseudomonadota bacterium]|jgi:flagellar motility protein MotE (MotC chaperone)
MLRVPILSLLATGAALAMVANVAAIAADLAPAITAAAAPSAAKPPPTRLGVAIAQSAAQRDAALAQQARQLDLRERLLRAAEARIARTQASAAPPPASAAAPAAAAAAPPPPADQDRIQGLARIYQAMKPAKAAAVFEKLELGVQVKIAREMSERSVAMMLNAMDPGRGAELSMALANRPPRVETAAAGASARPLPGKPPSAS